MHFRSALPAGTYITHRVIYYPLVFYETCSAQTRSLQLSAWLKSRKICKPTSFSDINFNMFVNRPSTMLNNVFNTLSTNERLLTVCFQYRIWDPGAPDTAWPHPLRPLRRCWDTNQCPVSWKSRSDADLSDGSVVHPLLQLLQKTYLQKWTRRNLSG